MNQQFPALQMLSLQNGRPPTDSLMPYHQLSGDQTKDLDKDQRQVDKIAVCLFLGAKRRHQHQ